MIEISKIQKMAEDFKSPRAEFNGESYITRRRDWFDKPMENIRPLLQKGRLENLTIEEAKRIYNEMSVGGPRLYPNTFVENGIEKIRSAMVYLLYSPDDLATRFYNFAGNSESPYRINGIGRAFTSTALFLSDHHNYGIWNTAVDGGLKLLGMLPTWKKQDNLGQQYTRLVKLLKELQVICGFEDLSATDEFLEMIFRGKIGEEIINPPPPPPIGPDPEPEVSKEEVGSHLRMQYLLVKIGLMQKHDVWVASNDQNKSYNGETLSTLVLNDLPHFAGPETMKTAVYIDVIWFKKGTAQPLAFFEIEHTTSIYSGLLRLNDVRIDYPIHKAYIVAPKERKSLFEIQIQRRTFSDSELGEVCKFWCYDDVEKLFKNAEELIKILT